MLELTECQYNDFKILLFIRTKDFVFVRYFWYILDTVSQKTKVLLISLKEFTIHNSFLYLILIV